MTNLKIEIEIKINSIVWLCFYDKLNDQLNIRIHIWSILFDECLATTMVEQTINGSFNLRNNKNEKLWIIRIIRDRNDRNQNWPNWPSKQNSNFKIHLKKKQVLFVKKRNKMKKQNNFVCLRKCYVGSFVRNNLQSFNVFQLSFFFFLLRLLKLDRATWQNQVASHQASQPVWLLLFFGFFCIIITMSLHTVSHQLMVELVHWWNK